MCEEMNSMILNGLFNVTVFWNILLALEAFIRIFSLQAFSAFSASC